MIRSLGGTGDDWLAGGPSEPVPDIFEISSGESNDNVSHASLLSEARLLPLRWDEANRRDVVIDGLSLGLGRSGRLVCFQDSGGFEVLWRIAGSPGPAKHGSGAV